MAQTISPPSVLVPPMPSWSVLQPAKPLRNTNSFHVGSYTMTWAPPGATSAPPVYADSGVVGAFMNGTNIQLATGSEPSFQGGMRGVIEDTNVTLNWYAPATSSLLWSADLIHWQSVTVTNMVHFVASVPKQQAGFFKMP